MRFRSALFVAGFYSILLFLPSVTIGQTNAEFQVVFSRRVYKERGRSFQQIWIWKPATGVLRALTHSSRNHFFPICTGGKINFFSSGYKWVPDSMLWSFDPTNGEERLIGPAPMPATPEPARTDNCEVFAKAESLEACGKEEDLSVSRDNKAIGHINISPDPNEQTPIASLEWSPDAKWLLVGAVEDVHEADYFVVNPTMMKLTKVATAETALWLPERDQIIFTTPQDLAQLTGSYERHKHFANIYGEFLNVWVQHLVLFNPATGKSTALTSGLTDNFEASLCSR